MSRSVDLFIQSTLSLDELAATIGRRVEKTLAPGPAPDSWVLSDNDVEAVLRAHPYVDDGELLFSHYPYALSASVANDLRLQDAPATDLLRKVADRLQRGEGIAVLLVLDLQYRDRASQPVVAAPTNGSGA
jgi:hypothetical protein